MEEPFTKEQVCQFLEKLTFRERTVIKLRLGIDELYSYTQKEVGMMFNVSKSRVSQVEKKAMRKIKFFLEEKSKE